MFKIPNEIFEVHTSISCSSQSLTVSLFEKESITISY